MKNFGILLLMIISSVIIAISCSSNRICTEATESLVQMRFKTISEGKVIDTAAYRLTVKGTPPPDSNEVLYNKKANLNKITLPIDHTQDYCSFLLTFVVPDTIVMEDTVIVQFPEFTDEITLHYTRKLQLVSPECGFSYEFTLDSVYFERNIIKNLEIVNPFITPDEVEHVKIYL